MGFSFLNGSASVFDSWQVRSVLGQTVAKALNLWRSTSCAHAGDGGGRGGLMAHHGLLIILFHIGKTWSIGRHKQSNLFGNLSHKFHLMYNISPPSTQMSAIDSCTNRFLIEFIRGQGERYYRLPNGKHTHTPTQAHILAWVNASLEHLQLGWAIGKIIFVISENRAEWFTFTFVLRAGHIVVNVLWFLHMSLNWERGEERREWMEGATLSCLVQACGIRVPSIWANPNWIYV